MRDPLKNNLRVSILLIALLAGVDQANAQTLGFEQKIPGWLKETNVPAVGVGVIENGKLKYAKVFGELKKGATPTTATSTSVTLSPSYTVFQVASLTKPIVEVLTLILVS